MNIILFGPPGIGKSTMIGTLKTLGQRAIDLEDIYPNRVRFTIPNIVDGVYIGAADLNPKRKYHNAKKVLLYMDQSAYDERRFKRDQMYPEKQSQSRHIMDDWLKDVEYDAILKMGRKDKPEKTVFELLHLFDLKKGGKEHV